MKSLFTSFLTSLALVSCATGEQLVLSEQEWPADAGNPPLSGHATPVLTPRPEVPIVDVGLPASTDAGAAPSPDAGPGILLRTVTDLNRAIDGALDGAHFVLANGSYRDVLLVMAKSGMAVRAETPGGVSFTGSSRVLITGDRNRLSGFQFLSGAVNGNAILEVSGDSNTLEHLNIQGAAAKTWIHIAAGSTDNEILYCNIEDKPPTASIIGAIIQISTDAAVVGRHRIRRSSFRNIRGPSGDFGNEPIRIGLSTERTNVSRSVVEDCYFDNVGGGDNETVSVKSAENAVRYNTFTNNPAGMVVFRHGNRNVAYGNFFLNNSGGIRIKEGNGHAVYNNYFETGSAAALVLTFVPEYPLDNLSFVHNTFTQMGGISLGGSGPTRVRFVNNIFQRATGNIFASATGNEVWTGNLYQGTLGLAAATGLRSVDPKLAPNPVGYRGPSLGSPAIDGATDAVTTIPALLGLDNDPAVLLDIGRRSRPAQNREKDVGCDEFGAQPAVKRPLSLGDVGPSYLAPRP